VRLVDAAVDAAADASAASADPEADRKDVAEALSAHRDVARAGVPDVSPDGLPDERQAAGRQDPDWGSAATAGADLTTPGPDAEDRRESGATAKAPGEPGWKSVGLPAVDSGPHSLIPRLKAAQPVSKETARAWM
jgi:hypothetical protein